MFINERNKQLNIDFKSIQEQSDIKAFKDVYGTHLKVGNQMYGDFPQLTKVDDYLYEITLDELDEDYVLNTIKGYKPSACSEIRNGDFIGRNYDWYYDQKCEFIVRTTAKENRHSSIGVASSRVSNQEVLDEKYSEALKLMPYQLLDGVNDCGVYCGINVVPVGDKGITTGTHPNKKDLPNVSIPRFVLDNASSAKEAIALLDTRNIFSIVYDDELIELHALICDANNTFIIEFVNNKLVVNEYEDKKAIMTNFYVTDWNGEIKSKCLGNTDEEVKETGLTPRAEGLERYLILQNGLDNVDSLDSALNLMKQVRFTKAYDKGMNPFWYSELVGARGLTIYNSQEEYEPVVDIFIDMFENRTRENPVTWQTVHTSCYDLVNKKFIVCVQELDTIYEYSLDVNEYTNDSIKTISFTQKV